MVLNYILLKNITWKKAVYNIKLYLQFLCIAGYLKHSTDRPNLNVHKYTNYNIIEIYINRLSVTTQIFIVMDYLIMMSEKYLYFRKRTNIWQGHFLPTSQKLLDPCTFEIFSELFLPKICTKTLKRNWNNSRQIKIDDFHESVIF